MEAVVVCLDSDSNKQRDLLLVARRGGGVGEGQLKWVRKAARNYRRGAVQVGNS